VLYLSWPEQAGKTSRVIGLAATYSKQQGSCQQRPGACIHSYKQTRYQMKLQLFMGILYQTPSTCLLNSIPIYLHRYLPTNCRKCGANYSGTIPVPGVAIGIVQADSRRLHIKFAVPFEHVCFRPNSAVDISQGFD
jgi:hypothetical protein